MPQVTAPNEIALKPRVYPATFQGIDVKTDGQFSEDGIYWMWNFRIQTKAGPQTVSGTSSTAFGTKSKPRQWAATILGRPIKVGETLELNDLIGRPCQLKVVIKQLDSGAEVNRIEAVLAAATDDDEDVLA